MKALFLVFHGFDPANGISKKIHYQVEALNACGLDTKLCYLSEVEGYKKRMVDDTVIGDYGKGVIGKILKRIEFDSVVRYIFLHNIDLVYIRSAHNAHPLVVRMLKKVHDAGICTVLEIPTFPYDKEYCGFREKMELLPDKCFRRSLMKYIDRIVTFSENKEIFGVPAIRISNGIDFDHIQVKDTLRDIDDNLSLIGVAEIHYWHGFDRLISGLGEYYKGNPSCKVYFHIVGEFFGEREKKEIMPLIHRYGLEKYVILHGAKHGHELDILFDRADMGVGSLARHRSGISSIKTLKNREYAARGIPFIYSENDNDFDNRNYILKVAADESPIDISALIRFRREIKVTPAEIRKSIDNLSWKRQMGIVIENVELFRRQ